ncbi:hypothetical protein SLEP1_g19260 [Rubroshorea leprosula]|nr:hypothetical protein SLEP1_g19260 [Rubroshorea leprosula]
MRNPRPGFMKPKSGFLAEPSNMRNPRPGWNLERKGALLSIGCDEQDPRCPYWTHSDHRFQFFHSMNSV